MPYVRAFMPSRYTLDWQPMHAASLHVPSHLSMMLTKFLQVSC